MTDDVQFPGGVVDPALLRLLTVAGQVFRGSVVWLQRNDLQDESAVLLGADGPVGRYPFSEEQLSEARFESRKLQEMFRDAQAFAEERDLVLRAAAPAAQDGVLLLAAPEERILSDEDREGFDALASQVGVIAERKDLAEAVDRLSRAEKGARESLVEMRRDFNLLTAHVLEVICKVDTSGVIHFVNTSAEKTFGFKQSDLIGRNVFELIHFDDRKRVRAALREGKNGGHFEVEVRCRCSDGHDYPFLFFGASLHDDDPIGEGFFIGGRNISRRRKAEADLRRLQSRFQSVWENSRDAMRLTDSHGTVLQVNDAYCRLVDKAREEVVGNLFIVPYYYDDPDAVLQRFRDRLASGTMPAQLELELTLWNGADRVFELSNSLFEMEEETILLTIYHDITDRRRREEELNLLNEALQQRATHLGALTLQLTRVEQEERRRLAEILHDHLQQLLVAARMGMERVRLRVPEETATDSFADMEHLLDEAIRASRSITMELCPPVLYDGGLLVALEWLGRRMFDKHGLKVRIEGETGTDRLCEVLRVFLFQAVRELLFNCWKHAAVDEVVVVVEPMTGERVRVTVKDEGAGFDVETIKPGGAGAGDRFGLFSLRERIGHIGGTMEVVAAPGKGTTIALVVPLKPHCFGSGAEEQPELVRHQAGARRSGSDGDWVEESGSAKVRLVLVDDHKIMRQGLRELLREQPDMVVVGEAENGLEGLKLAQDLQPDLVVMDISMPIMNGIEATRVLTAELPHIKVIGLSMHIKEDMATAILAAGACAYVTKSTAAETLTGTIRRAVGVDSDGGSILSDGSDESN